MGTEYFTGGEVPSNIRFGDDAVTTRFRALLHRRWIQVSAAREAATHAHSDSRDWASSGNETLRDLRGQDAEVQSLLNAATEGYWKNDPRASAALALLNDVDHTNSFMPDWEWTLQHTLYWPQVLRSQLSALDADQKPGLRRLAFEEVRRTGELRASKGSMTYRWLGCPGFHAPGQHLTFSDPDHAKWFKLRPQYSSVVAYWIFAAFWSIFLLATLIGAHMEWAYYAPIPQWLAGPLLVLFNILTCVISTTAVRVNRFHPGNTNAETWKSEPAQFAVHQLPLVLGLCSAIVGAITIWFLFWAQPFIGVLSHADYNFFDVCYWMFCAMTVVNTVGALFLRHRIQAYVTGIWWVIKYADRSLTDWKTTKEGRHDLLEKIQAWERFTEVFKLSPRGLLDRLYETLEAPTVH